jgi:hypothetical protein
MAGSAHLRGRRGRVVLPVVLLLLSVGQTGAQSNSVPPKDDTAGLILSSPPPAAAKKTPPASSAPATPALGLDVSAVMPSYRPAGPADPYPAGVDLRTVDKPRNQIPRLPVEMMQRYVVRESKEPVFRTRDLLTKAGMIDLAFKEHPGLRFGNFFNLNAPEAYDRAITEALAESRRDLADLSFAMAVGDDTAEAEAMQQDILDASFAKQTQVGAVGIK